MIAFLLGAFVGGMTVWLIFQLAYDLGLITYNGR